MKTEINLTLLTKYVKRILQTNLKLTVDNFFMSSNSKTPVMFVTGAKGMTMISIKTINPCLHTKSSL